MFYRDTLMAHEWNPTVCEEYQQVKNERQWLLVKGDGSKKLAFLNCYIACQSFTSDEFIEWNEALFQLMTQEALYLKKDGFMILAMGDFNTHVGQLPGLNGNTPHVNRNYPMFNSFISDINLVIINTLPLSNGLFTRFRGHQRSLLDYGLVDSDNVHNILSFNVDEDARFGCFTDHALIESTIQFQSIWRPPRDYQEMIKYNFRDGSDFTSYKTILDSYLMSINLDDFAQLSLPEMLSHIASNIHKAAKDSFGLKVTKNKQYNTQLPAHILKTIKKKKDTAKSLHVAILNNNQEEAMHLQKKYDDLKYEVDKGISDMRIRRRNRLRTKLLRKDPSRKKFWKFLKNQVKSDGDITALLTKVMLPGYRQRNCLPVHSFIRPNLSKTESG